MAAVLRDRHGKDHTVFDRDSMLKLIEEIAGTEIRDYLVESFEEEIDMQDQIISLESEPDQQKQYFENKLKNIDEFTSELAMIIRQKEIDRKKLSEMAGKVRMEIRRR